MPIFVLCFSLFFSPPDGWPAFLPLFFVTWGTSAAAVAAASTVCMVTHIARVWINRVRLPILLVVSWTGKMNISLSAFAPENLVSRDGFSRPVPRQAAHLHTQAESINSAYSRDSSRVPRRRPFVYLKLPYAIESVPSLSGHAIAYRWRSLPRVRRHMARKPQGSSERVLPGQFLSMLSLLLCSDEGSAVQYSTVPPPCQWMGPHLSKGPISIEILKIVMVNNTTAVVMYVGFTLTKPAALVTLLPIDTPYSTASYIPPQWHSTVSFSPSPSPRFHLYYLLYYLL